jgi:hypothetical protein
MLSPYHDRSRLPLNDPLATRIAKLVKLPSR